MGKGPCSERVFWDSGCTPGTDCPPGFTPALGRGAVADRNWASSHWILHTGCKSKKEEAHGEAAARAVGEEEGREGRLQLS